MTNSEKIAYKNLTAKLEKALAKFDIIEQENRELRKENVKLTRENDNLVKANAKLEDIATKQCTALNHEIAKLNQEIVAANDKKKEDAKTIKKLQQRVNELNATITDLKANKIKNSSNSSKPSSTDGFKKVVQNNRVKSGKPKGGQKGRAGKTLKTVDNPNKIIDVFGDSICSCGGKILYDCEYIKKQVIDILNELEVIEYRYHTGVCEKCGKKYTAKIPTEHANPVQYSSKLAQIVPVIRNISNMSIETTQNVFNSLFNGLHLSTGWIHKQDALLANKCDSVIKKIKEYLTSTPLAHSDETGVRVEDKLGCCIAFSDKNAVLYDIFKSKAKASFDEFGVFNKFNGILSHDHNLVYYKYIAITHAECNVHILRYLKAVIELFDRQGAKNFSDFIKAIYTEKLDAIANNKTCFEPERIAEIEANYLKLLAEWENEYNAYISQLKHIPKTLREERNLFTRLREYKEEHLRFVKNFEVPFSNNEAERNLRKIKIKLNVSKRFGKLECAKKFAVIKTIIETAKKQHKDIFHVFSEISKGNYEVFDLNLKKQASY